MLPIIITQPLSNPDNPNKATPSAITIKIAIHQQYNLPYTRTNNIKQHATITPLPLLKATLQKTTTSVPNHPHSSSQIQPTVHPHLTIRTTIVHHRHDLHSPISRHYCASSSSPIYKQYGHASPAHNSTTSHNHPQPVLTK